MTFDQSSWQLHNSRVYNIAGDLHLTEQSGPREFADAVTRVQADLGALDYVPESERAALDGELALVVEEATAEGDAAPDAMVGRLTRVAGRLRALRGATTAAVELGNSVDSLAQWAGHHF
ncbi:hypothetical protein ABZT04_06750 [Streptomyces sp. NPDC005492]|uniref:hypothetical protein n=1 Tax=Streptomyces sp. NPDC005492 TaxID=3156883 RepID=UPI0033A6BF6C